MYHRMATGLGLGNPSKCQLNNEWTDQEPLNDVIKAMLSEAIDKWFKEEEGVDFTITLEDNEIAVRFGIEPSYVYEPLKVYCISTNKDHSYYSTGRAWGAYGSGIASTMKLYKDYKYSSKFTRFVDKWSAELKRALETIIDNAAIGESNPVRSSPSNDAERERDA